jgi:hypothetical protein
MSGKRIPNAMEYEFIAPNKKQIIIGLILSYIYFLKKTCGRSAYSYTGN